MAGASRRADADAHLIFLIIGRTEGVLWEIRRIRTEKLLARMVLVFPPPRSDELQARWQPIRDELGLSQSTQAMALESTLLLIPSVDGEPACVTAKARSAHYYREAVAVAGRLAAAAHGCASRRVRLA